MDKLRKHKKDLILCGPHSQPLFALTRAGLIDRLGLQNVCGDIDASLTRAKEILSARGHKSQSGSGPVSEEKAPEQGLAGH
jgi:hypothetical protein